MAVEYFNSFGGYSVGIPAIPIVDANGNIISNFNNLAGNVSANKVYANSYFYANGQPFTSNAAGNNFQLQYNNNGAFGGIPNVTFNGTNLSLGNVANLKIGGGTSGYYLQTDGNGNLAWVVGGGSGNGEVGGSNTQIQFNDSGSFAGSAALTFDKTTNTFFSSNVSSINANITNVSVTTANIQTVSSGQVSVTGNVLAGNLYSNGVVRTTALSSTTGNIGVTGNLTIGSQANLRISEVSRLSIPGGINGYYLQTDGTGNLTWAAGGSGGNGSPGGSNTQVQYNKTGTFSGSQFFTFNDATNTLQVAGKIVGNSIQLGAGIYRFSDISSTDAVTNSVTPNQVIYSWPSDTVTGIDFEIIAMTSSLDRTNSFKMSTLFNGTTVDYTEYGGIYTNGSIGDFSVTYNPGNIITQPAIEVLVTPNSNSLTTYRLLSTVYYE
jgi:hypothetical protein